MEVTCDHAQYATLMLHGVFGERKHLMRLNHTVPKPGEAQTTTFDDFHPNFLIEAKSELNSNYRRKVKKFPNSF